jgi:hypothetical protein
MFKPYHIASPHFRNRYSGIYSLNDLIRPTDMSGLVMYHDCSLGGLTAVGEIPATATPENYSTWLETRLDYIGGDASAGYTYREDSDTGYHQLYSPVTFITTPVQALYFKAKIKRGVGTRNVEFYCGGLIVVFELTGAGTVTVSSGTDLGCAITGPDADGFYMCTVDGLTPNSVAGTDTIARLRFHNGSTNSYAGDSTSTLIVKGVSSLVGARYNAWADQVDGDYDLGQVTGTYTPDRYSAAGALSAINGIAVPRLKYAITYGKYILVASAKAKTNRLHNAADSCTLVCAFRLDALTAVPIVNTANSNVASARGFNLRVKGDGALICRVRTSTATNGLDYTGATSVLVPGRLYVVTYRKSAGARPTAHIRLNGVEYMANTVWTEDATTGDSTDTYRWGWRFDNCPDISPFGDVLYNRVLSDAECLRVEQYFAAKMGITI